MNSTQFSDKDVINLIVDYQYSSVINSVAVQVCICFLYSFIIILGISGNGLVVYVVARNNAMHTVTNLLVASLAVNDIVVCIFTGPVTPLYAFLDGWYFGPVMCRLIPWIQTASVHISALTLSMIAVERFCVVCFPHMEKLTPKLTYLIIASIWFLSLSICTPYALFVKYSLPGPNDLRGPSCDEDSSSFTWHAFRTVSPVLQCLFPLVVITASYVCIWLKLRSQAAKGVNRTRIVPPRKRRTNRMLLAMVIIFAVCWLPLNLINIITVYCPRVMETLGEYYDLLFFSSHIMAVSSTCYNPFLYAWMNTNFRKEFEAVLPCSRATTKPRRENVPTQCQTITAV